MITSYYLDLYYIIVCFILGIVLGSFFNVVGYRLPKGESILTPPSHCPKCQHKLSPIELIPILSFIIQRGKCKKCGLKISWFYPTFELLTGLFFSLSYVTFGISLDFIIAITLVSMLLIIIISDYLYMVILDEILIVFSILLAIELCIRNGLVAFGWSMVDGMIAFSFMFLLKKFGDFLFKKESMGGGDIKLLFILGMVFKWENALLIIFLGSLIGLPVSLMTINKNEHHIIPFGPFLSAGALLILFSRINVDWIIELLR